MVQPEVLLQFMISPRANWHIYCNISSRMVDCGHNRSPEQCCVKAKSLCAKLCRDVAKAEHLGTPVKHVLHYQYMHPVTKVMERCGT